MSIINLNQQEIEVVKASIDLRIKSYNVIPDQISQLNEILERIMLDYIDLKPLQRAKLIGCIKEYLIYPNEDLFKLSDFEVLCSSEKVKDQMRKVDIGLKAINKLKTKKDKISRIFEDVIEKCQQLSTAKTIFFSETAKGEIYKLGIVGSNGLGIRIESGGPNLGNFNLEKIRSDEYMNSALPMELIAKINTSSQGTKVAENKIRVTEILRKLASV